jgi:hypothetical protein
MGFCIACHKEKKVDCWLVPQLRVTKKGG